MVVEGEEAEEGKVEGVKEGKVKVEVLVEVAEEEERVVEEWKDEEERELVDEEEEEVEVIAVVKSSTLVPGGGERRGATEERVGWRGESVKERRRGGVVEEEEEEEEVVTMEYEETEDEEDEEGEDRATLSLSVSFLVCPTVPPLSIFPNTCSSSTSITTASLPPPPAPPRLDCPFLSLIVNHYRTSLSSSVFYQSHQLGSACVCLDFSLAYLVSLSRFNRESLVAYSLFHCLLYV